MMTIRSPMKSLSTPLFVSFFETILPTVAPITAHAIIENRSTRSTSGMVLVTAELMNETACEKKMI